MGSKLIRVGSRGSALALAQANWVADGLRAGGAETEIVVIRTVGDDRAPDTAWGEGAFVRTIEAALAESRIDTAVHSAKDVPTDPDPRLAIAAWTVREDPRDALVCRVKGTTLETLPPSARIGTDSPRRAAFLLAARPDLQLHPLSGNVDTRLRKLDEGQSDALVLAVAGLSRLDRLDRIDQVLPLDVAVPAPGQGALALQVRADDERALGIVGTLDDRPTRIAVEAERAFLTATGGGCRSPIGAFGEITDETLTLHVAAQRELALPDGRTVAGGIVRWTERAPVADWRRLAESLAERVVAARTRPRVLVTRPLEGASLLLAALRVFGFDPLHVPTIEVRRELDEPTQAMIVEAARGGARIVATSPNGVRAALAALDAGRVSAAETQWAVVGRASEAILGQRGASAFVPSRPLGAVLFAELPLSTGERQLVVRGDLADPSAVEILRRRGAVFTDVIGYRTLEGPPASLPLLAAALDGPIDVIVFASGSAIRGLLALTSEGTSSLLRAIPAVCIGPSTAAVARDHRFSTIVEAEDADAGALARAVVRALTRTDVPDALAEQPSAITSGVAT